MSRVGELEAGAVVDAGVRPEGSARELRNWSEQPVSMVEWVRLVPCCSAASKGAVSRPSWDVSGTEGLAPLIWGERSAAIAVAPCKAWIARSLSFAPKTLSVSVASTSAKVKGDYYHRRQDRPPHSMDYYKRPRVFPQLPANLQTGRPAPWHPPTRVRTRPEWAYCYPRQRAAYAGEAAEES
jgi:hypothetical protein